jgi:microcystin-dependent protein
MAEPFLAEIRLMSFNFPPKGWALCNGQFLPINQNQALFSLLGTTYGGNGQTTFALPDLRGKTPMHMGSGHTLGETGGQEATTLNITQLPTHTHQAASVNASASTNSPNGAYLAASTAVYHGPTSLISLSPATITTVGGSQAHTNMQPFLALNFCIALQGIFPSQN